MSTKTHETTEQHRQERQEAAENVARKTISLVPGRVAVTVELSPAEVELVTQVLSDSDRMSEDAAYTAFVKLMFAGERIKNAGDYR